MEIPYRKKLNKIASIDYSAMKSSYLIWKIHRRIERIQTPELARKKMDSVQYSRDWFSNGIYKLTSVFKWSTKTQTVQNQYK